MAQTVTSFSAPAADGAMVPLDRFAGQVLVIVNTASRCGFTPQYAGLQALQHDYAGQGFSVLGFPCNQFAGQEPADDAAIGQFCDTAYQVTFPVFAKADVNGASALPLFDWLKRQAPGLLGTRAIKWNFTKFLIGRDGTVRRRYAPLDTPDKLRTAIAAALGEPAAP